LYGISIDKEVSEITAQTKKKIREEILKQRDSLSPDAIGAAKEQMMSQLLQLKEFIGAKQLFTYLSFRSEIPTAGIIQYCWQQGKSVTIPVCVGDTKEMVLSYYDKDSILTSVKYGLREPTLETLRFGDRDLLDAALIPGSAFDRRGYRVGYGAGYYDKFFSHTKKTIVKIALAYSFQVIHEVPKSSYDVPMDFIVTEKEIIECMK
jgi:5-formyltetrahydrofolate cyclo-ligase